MFAAHSVPIISDVSKSGFVPKNEFSHGPSSGGNTVNLCVGVLVPHHFAP